MDPTGYPLQGIRILDMATVLAAPFSATLCGDMGAEVVKLELPQGNDALRGLAPVHGEHALFWKTANRGADQVRRHRPGAACPGEVRSEFEHQPWRGA